MKGGFVSGIIGTALITILCQGNSHAASLTLSPSSTTVIAGDLVNVEAVIAGLNTGGPPSVGAFDLNVGIDSALLSPDSVTFGPFLGSVDETLTDFSFATPRVVNFAELSLLSPAELDALQPASFVLATLTFDAVAAGIASFTFVGDLRVDDAFGNKLPIPEPPMAYLLGIAIAGFLARRIFPSNLVATDGGRHSRGRSSGEPWPGQAPG